MVATLTFTASDEEIIDGIPKTLTISTNEPATIYYTLDGGTPSLLSTVYTEPLELATDENSVTVSAIAYTVDGYQNLYPSAILSNVYAPDGVAIDRTRWIDFEGVLYSYPGGLDIPLYYDEDGHASVTVDFPLDQVEVFESKYDYLGNPVDDPDAVELIDPDETATLTDNDIPAYWSPNGADTYYPNAKYIVIDHRDSADDPTIDLINGPFMTLRDRKKYWSGADYFRRGSENYISGKIAKLHYDRTKNLMVAYYFDSSECRWIKSIGPLDDAPVQEKPVTANPLVFRWNMYGRQQSM